MENLFESLVSLQERLHRSGISSAVIGGVAVGVWSEPRLLEILTHNYITLQSDPLQALTRTGILFVQDEFGTRLDLLLSDTEFDAEAIRNSMPVDAG